MITFSGIWHPWGTSIKYDLRRFSVNQQCNDLEMNATPLNTVITDLFSENRYTNLIGGEKNMEVSVTPDLFLELCPSFLYPQCNRSQTDWTEAE